MLFRWETCIAVGHRLKLRDGLETCGIFFFIYFEPYEPMGGDNSKKPKIRTTPIYGTYTKVLIVNILDIFKENKKKKLLIRIRAIYSQLTVPRNMVY